MLTLLQHQHLDTDHNRPQSYVSYMFATSALIQHQLLISGDAGSAVYRIERKKTPQASVQTSSLLLEVVVLLL